MKCPVCGRAGIAEYKPFCSKRCSDVDLGRWLNERYSIPATEPAEDAPGEDLPDKGEA